VTASQTTQAAAVADLADLAESWYIALEAQGRSKQTVRAYKAGVDGFLAWSAKQGPAAPVLDRPAVAAYLADQRRAGLSPGTRKLRYIALRLLSKWLARVGEITRDELLDLDPPKGGQAPVDGLSGEQLRALVRACKGPRFIDKRDEALVRLIGERGLRADEAIKLRKDAIDLKAREVTVHGKGDKYRTLRFGPETALALDRYLRGRGGRKHHKLADISDALWLPQSGTSFGYQGLSRALKLRAEAAGIQGFHLHQLRHTAASAWLDAGGSEDGLMATMGWKSRDMISRYTADTAARRAMDEADRLRLDKMG
jgi:integrase/recombinase XerD